MNIRDAIDALEKNISRDELKKIGPDAARLVVEAIRAGDLTPAEAAANIRKLLETL